MYVDLFFFQFLCNALATSKTFKDDSLMVIYEGIVVFLILVDLKLDGGRIPERYKIFHYNIQVSKTELKDQSTRMT